MKKNLFFCFILCLFSLAQSQTSFNRAYHSINEISNPFVLEINGIIFHSSTNIDAFSFGNSNLYSHSLSGNLNFKQSLIVPSNPLLAFKSLDDKLILVGGSPPCDVIPQTQKNYLVKLNTNGTAVFQCTYNIASYNNPKACVQAPDSSYYTFTDSSIIKISKSGQFNFKISSGFSEVSSAILLPNNTILVSAKVLNVNSFGIVSLSGTILNIVSTPTLFTQLAFYGGQKIMALGQDGNLYKFLPSLNLVANSNIPNGESVTRFVASNDSLYCLLSSSATASSYGVCDTLFNFFIQTTTNTNKVYQKAIGLVANNQVAIISDVVSHDSQNFGFFNSSIHRQSNLSVINKFSSNNFKKDLALISIVEDSSYAVCPSGPLQSPPCVVYLRAKVKIKNVGLTNINSFKLNCYENPAVACGDFFYQQQFSQLNLAPNDTLWVATNRFVSSGYITATSSITQVPFCFYVSVPNDEVDKTLQNNELCKTFNIITTGLREKEQLESKTKIYPNPFKTELKIESSEPILNYKITNFIGKHLQEGHSESNTLDLKTEHLVSGIYFLIIETKVGIVTKKLIKE